jgi:hypothetical protein
MVVRLLWLSLICAQNPKSAVRDVRFAACGWMFYLLSLILPSNESRMLSDLMSR